MCAFTRSIKYTAAVAVAAAAGFGIRHLLITGQLNRNPLRPPAVNAADEPKADAVAAGKSDHVMFGGTPGRNMVNLIDKNVPGTFGPEKDAKWRADAQVPRATAAYDRRRQDLLRHQQRKPAQ